MSDGSNETPLLNNIASEEAPAVTEVIASAPPPKPISEPLSESIPPPPLPILKTFASLLCGVIVVSLILVALYGVLPVVITPLMLIRVAEGIGQGKIPQIERNWVDIDDMAKPLQNAMVAAEDMKFFSHHGFDWEAIEGAMRANVRGRKIRGGSTISQQTAKNVFLWPRRSWLRKGAEAYFTGLIECFWTKRRIMEVYLNVIELGDGVYGVEAASQKFFHKPAAKLSSSEAALIAAVLPNPRLFKLSSPSPYVRFRQSLIMRRMSSAGRTVPAG
jgi:monofunctional biosynthetic peptidoglycan transglycosylase